jgi:hypothetical protein
MQNDNHESANLNSVAAVPLRLMRRLTRSAGALAVTAFQSWAWSSLAVPVALMSVAVLAYLVSRRSGHARLGAALDSVLVTAAGVLDPDNVGAPAPHSPPRRIQHAIIRRITQGAVARRSTPTPDSSLPTPPADVQET